VTASEQNDDGAAGASSVVERALDVLVYLPAGAVVAALEDVPDTVAKGRARVEQELRNAKVVGRFAVDFGWRQLKELAGERPMGPGSGPEGAPDARATGARGAGGGARARRDIREEPPAARPRPATPPRDPEVDRAIPDYDILAASQVVRRLDGLGHGELRAVVRHERSTRGRRTIIRRAEQLLGSPSPTHSPGTPGTSSPA